MNLAREKERLKSIKGEREKDVEMKTEDKERKGRGREEHVQLESIKCGISTIFH